MPVTSIPFISKPHFGGLSERSKTRIRYAGMDGGELLTEIRKLDEAIQSAPTRSRKSLSADLSDAVDVLIMKLEALDPNQVVYFRNASRILESLKSDLPQPLLDKYVQMLARKFL
jgi:hypothetical protein